MHVAATVGHSGGMPPQHPPRCGNCISPQGKRTHTLWARAPLHRGGSPGRGALATLHGFPLPPCLRLDALRLTRVHKTCLCGVVIRSQPDPPLWPHTSHGGSKKPPGDATHFGSQSLTALLNCWSVMVKAAQPCGGRSRTTICGRADGSDDRVRLPHTVRCGTQETSAAPPSGRDSSRAAAGGAGGAAHSSGGGRAASVGGATRTQTRHYHSFLPLLLCVQQACPQQ